MSAREIYDNSIRQLPAMDRLRLASIILDDLAKSSTAELDIRDDWSDQDLADLTRFSMKQAAGAIGPEDVDA